MPSDQITIKHNKHRIHPCPSEKKLSLLDMLISQNNTLKIVVVLSNNDLLTKEAISSKNITVLNDEELMGLPELKCELLISYDLPQTAELYISRLAKATDSAIVLLDISEQKHLYPIETLLGRVIRQEIIAGFEYAEQAKMKIAPKPAIKPKRDEKRAERKPFEKPKYNKKPFDKPKSERPKRDGESSERKPFEKPKYDKPKRDSEKPERKPSEKPKYDKKPNKFLGKDENGKAKFSSKSGERNHRYDGKPKDTTETQKNVGRKISIKERKPKKNEEPSS